MAIIILVIPLQQARLGVPEFFSLFHYDNDFKADKKTGYLKTHQWKDEDF